MATLAGDGHQAALVGGCVRDLLAGGQPTDWDLATSAEPARVASLFPGSTWENPFGTVTVHGAGGPVEVTTFRSEGGYRDGRHPSEIRWGQSLTDDLARRDFTINAAAWVPLDLDAGRGTVVDPHHGQADLEARVLRAVGDPAERFAEDALRLLRAVRFAATLGLTIEPGTADAIRAAAPAAERLSAERVRDELVRMMAAPGRAAGLLEEFGLLAVVLPEVAALRGVTSGSGTGGDALEHSLRTADALPDGDAVLRFAGLLHDIGMASVPDEPGDHETRGASRATSVMERLHFSRTDVERVARVIGHHRFAYRSDWTDAAVRRFVRRIGPGQPLADAIALRRADIAAAGTVEVPGNSLEALLDRIQAVAGSAAMSTADLAVDGHDLMAELGLPPGPRIGLLLDALLEAVTDDPALNTRDRLLVRASEIAGGDHEHHFDPGETGGFG
jgi:poly(A) polymerase/tRNA nucleotidyltransferase (CCA-adding enzyme)